MTGAVFGRGAAPAASGAAGVLGLVVAGGGGPVLQRVIRPAPPVLSPASRAGPHCGNVYMMKDEEM